jgi:hypothetical protein
MSKSSTTFESEVKNCYAYGKFAVELLERVATDHKMNFETLWGQYFPNLSHVKALKNARHFIKQCDPRNGVAPAKSDYHFYLTEQSKSIQEKGEVYDIAKHGKEIGNRWKALSESERTIYSTLATADRERRQGELDAIEERIKSGTLPDSPFRRSPRHRTGNVSALNMYVREMTQKIRELEPTLPNTARMQRIHVQWKQLTADDHKLYQALADAANKANAESKATETGPVVTAVSAAAKLESKAKATKAAKPVKATPTTVAAAVPVPVPAPTPVATKAAKGAKATATPVPVAPVATPATHAKAAPAAKSAKPVKVEAATPAPAKVEAKAGKKGSKGK